jgi:hypothetical protein
MSSIAACQWMSRLELLKSQTNPPREFGGSATNDRVFLLSEDEADRYFAHSTDRRAYYLGALNSWWLRSPGDRASRAAIVDYDGSVNAYGSDVHNGGGGVRPALWLNL